VSKSVPPSSRPSAGISSGSGNRLIEAWSSLDKAEEFRKTGHYAEAKSICEQLLRLYPDYVGALHTLGLILAEMGEHAAAISHLSTAVALNPRDWKILTALSGCYIHTGAHEMAARMLEQAQRLKPRDPAILLTLGEIYRQEREYDRGAEAFKEAFALDGSLQSALLGRVVCCMQMGDEDAAFESLRILLDMGARDINTISWLAIFGAIKAILMFWSCWTMSTAI
jgi:tetratricopeptide (TPR) repeat protein